MLISIASSTSIFLYIFIIIKFILMHRCVHKHVELDLLYVQSGSGAPFKGSKDESEGS